MLTFRESEWHCPPRRWQIEIQDAFKRHYESSNTPALASVIMGAGKSKATAQLLRDVVIPNGFNAVVTTSTVELVNDLYNEFRAALEPLQISVGRFYGSAKQFAKVNVVCNDSMEKYAATSNAPCHLLIADEADTTECETYLAGYNALHPQYTFGLTATPFRASEKTNLSLFDTVIYRYGLNEAMRDGGVLCDWRIIPWTGDDSTPLDEVCIQMIRGTVDPFPLLCNAANKADADQFAAYLNANGIRAKVVYSGIHEFEIRQRFTALQKGELDALVHVNKISRGSNYPFLKTILMRRKVESRTRFVQEVGRMLRSHPGKEYATLLDPLDRFGRFKLTYTEAVGSNDVDDEPEEKISLSAVARELGSGNNAVSLTALEMAIRVLTVACDIAHPQEVTLTRKKRNETALPQQIAAIQGLAEVVVATPDTHEVWRAIVARFPEAHTRGMADDAIFCLQTIIKKGWPDIDEFGIIRRAKPGHLFCNEGRRKN